MDWLLECEWQRPYLGFLLRCYSHPLSCDPEPVPGPWERQSDVALYIVGLRAARASCRDALATVRDLVHDDMGEVGEMEDAHQTSATT